ncbi:Mannan endo-1,4-beta-mannosidase precursor [compost metagenome]
MKKFRKLVVTSLTAVMLMSAVAPAMAQTGKTTTAQAAAASFQDATGHWAASSIAKWTSNGVISGYGDGTFHPNQSITRAEFVTVLNKLFGLSVKATANFSDVPASAWYSDQLAIAKNAGYYEGFSGNQALATTEITRQDAATLLARIFELSASSSQTASVSAFKDSGTISSYAKDAVAALSDAIKGYEDGSFQPKGKITRAETVALIDRIVSGYFPAAGEQIGGTVSGNAVVPHAGTVLKDAVISGNLYLTAGIGSGDAKLDGVTVKGKTVVAGGGEHTVTFNNSTLNELNVNRKDGRVRVLASGTTRIAGLTVNSNSKLELESGAVIDQLVLNAPCEIVIPAGAKIGTLVISGNAANSIITGNGDIGTVTINASSVSINGTVLSNGTVSVVGGKIVAPTATASATATPASGGSSGEATPAPTATPAASPTPSATATPTVTPDATVNLADKDASAATRSLFVYLNELRGKHILFGQQHATDEALSAPVNGVTSDTYAAVGDNPAVYGWDTLSLEGFEKPGALTNTPEQNRDALIASMKSAYESGGVLTLSSHMPNFVTGKDFYDTTGNVVSHILPDGDKNAEYNAFLDKIADFALNLKDDSGNPIPVIFRPFHEQNGNWFWWGATFTTSQQYQEIYRYTVEYLRDIKGVHNFLYGFSPGSPFNSNEDTFLKTYPGDDYVDLFGFDTYYDGNNQSWFDGVVKDAKLISQLADNKGKIAAFTEFGYANVKPTGTADLKFYTKLVDALKSDPDASRMAYMLTWANFNSNSIYVPYRNSPEYGDHELLPDFTDYYNDDYTYFDRELSGVYNKNVATEEEKPFLHIVSPVAQTTIQKETTTVRAKILETQPAKVVYLVQGSDTEHEMTLDSQGFYSAAWQPSADLNGEAVQLTVKAYAADGSVIQQTITVYLNITEITLKQFTFDNDITGVQSAGVWSQSGNMTASFEHAVWNGDGKLQTNVTGLVYGDTWQEVKIGLPDIADSVDLKKVNRISFDVWIPLVAGEEAAKWDTSAAAEGTVYVSPAGTKFESNSANLSSLEKVTVGDAVYGKYTATIDLNDKDVTDSAAALELSLVGKSLNYDGPLYIDNIRLINAYTSAPADPTLADNFEGYKGSDALLGNTYTPKGDANSITLDSAHAKNGDYALKLDYTLAGQGYTGIVKSLGTADWSKTGKLKFWLVPDGSNNKLVIQVKANGVSFEAYPSLQGTEAGWVEIPFKDFTVASWESAANQAKKLDTVNAKKVTEFAIYINRPDGSTDTSSMSSTLYFDDIQAVEGAEGDIPVGTETEEDTGLPTGTIYGFEAAGDADNWKVSSSTVAQTPAVTDEFASEGTHSLKTTFTLDAGINFELKNEQSLDLSNSKTLKAKVKLSSGTVNVYLYIKTGSGWTWYDNGKVNGVTQVDSQTDGFTTVTFSLDNIPDLNDVRTIGLKIEGISGTTTSTIYLDEVTNER